MNDCKECAHFKVCRYKESYNEFVNRVTTTAYNEENSKCLALEIIGEIKIPCKLYTGQTINFRK